MMDDGGAGRERESKGSLTALQNAQFSKCPKIKEKFSKGQLFWCKSVCKKLKNSSDKPKEKEGGINDDKVTNGLKMKRKETADGNEGPVEGKDKLAFGIGKFYPSGILFNF
jgi:hypothetical protein